ncbi:MAG TPA: hypothetical protein VKP69_23110 [Isosphaeraceae bacterium]|nr:hypothetical protein [Isosphaeraceae bacterium]
MRLTLRTLLAWLDDTLPPSEVREIGKQVGESPFAQELVDRIHRVTRQRRLTIPSEKGPDSSDPNLVAAYLDNELDPDLVADYEKKCLMSDVHLAEVASVHQILSLIGQKAKVPNEARTRMYHLVKGRESAAPRERKATGPAEPAPVSEPIPPWVAPEPPSRPWTERFGPAALVVLLLAVLCWSAWMSLSPSGTEVDGPVASNVPTAKGAADRAAAQPAGSGETNGTVKPAGSPASAKPGGPSPPIEEPAPKPAPEGPKATAPAPKPAAELPPGTTGFAAKPEGILLRYNPEGRQWDLLTARAPLKTQDRVLSLQPFRNALVLGAERAEVDLVEETEVWVLAAPPTEAARLDLAQGRVVLHGVDGGQPFVIRFAGRDVSVAPPPGAVVGVERLSNREPGAATPSGSVLRFYAPEGTVELAVDGAKHTLAGPGVASLGGGEWTDEGARQPPAWVTEPKPSTYDQKVGEQFASLIHPGRPIITEIVAATEDPQIDVRRLAIQALRAVGDISYVVPLLSKRDDPVSRRAAIDVLRASLRQGPDALKDLRNQLLNDYGPDLAATVERLLIGYTPGKAREDATFHTLVQLLSSDDVGVRELALDNLQALTGRDPLDYDPDKPEGRGLLAWRDLLRDHELRPAGALKGGTPAAKGGEAATGSRKAEK